MSDEHEKQIGLTQSRKGAKHGGYGVTADGNGPNRRER